MFRRIRLFGIAIVLIYPVAIVTVSLLAEPLINRKITTGKSRLRIMA